MTAPAYLYRGSVMHARLKPKPHRFSYRVFSLLVDLDRLGAAARQSWLFSVNRFNLLAFHERDFGEGAARGLREHVDALLRQAGLGQSCARVLLLCYPRLFGYAFNPLAIYYCLDEAGEPCAMIYEVRNTFGQKHSYVAPIRCGDLDVRGVHQQCDKLLYVSPFLGMAMRYRFRLSRPGESLRVRILENDSDGPILAATFSGRREALSTPGLLRALLAVPLLTFKVVAGIHYEAFRLWWKGIAVKRRPAPPPPVSFGAVGPTPRDRTIGAAPAVGRALDSDAARPTPYTTR